MVDPSEAQSHLLGELSSHQIPLTSDDVSWAFANPKTALPVTDWVERYLGKDTLVSLEEAEIYNHLKKTGNLSKLQKQHQELRIIRPKFENELRVEMEVLQRSTEMLKQQTAQLQRQSANLKAMKERTKLEKEKKRKIEQKRRKRWVTEMEHEQAAIDDLLGILREEIVDFKQNTKASSLDLEGIEKILHSDDRVLGRLGRLADGVIVNGDAAVGDNEVVEKVTVLVRKLSMLSAASLKAKLDRMFLEIVNLDNNTNSADSPDSGTITELKQDLETLYTEIPSVAQMAAEQEYLRPVIKEAENGKKKGNEGLKVGGAYIRDVLEHLQKRNASAAERLKRELAKARAISQIIATIEQEAKSPLNKQVEVSSSNDEQKADGPSVRPSTPVKNPHPFKNMPIFTPPNRRRGGSIGADYRNIEELPELRMLTLLGVPVPSMQAQNASYLFASPAKGGPVSGATQEMTASRYKYLDAQVRQQSEKVQTQDQDVSAEMEIHETINDFWNVARIAQEALMWANVFPPLARKQGIMSFMGEDLIDGLAEIERKVNIVAGRMGGLARGLGELEKSGGDLHGQGREKRAFVDRWGRR